MATVVDSGTLTATAAEQDLKTGADFTTAGTYVLAVDTTNMANGDTIQIKAYVKTLAGSAITTSYVTGNWSHAQGDNVKMSIPIPVTHYVRFTLVQPDHPNGFRNFDWEVMTVT